MIPIFLFDLFVSLQPLLHFHFVFDLDTVMDTSTESEMHSLTEFEVQQQQYAIEHRVHWKDA